MKRLYTLLTTLIADDRGQDLVEYALLVALVAITAGATLPSVAPELSNVFSKVGSIVAKAAA